MYLWDAIVDCLTHGIALGTAPPRASVCRSLSKWKGSLIEQIQAIEATRSAHPRLGVRLKNMLAFLGEQCAAITRAEGSVLTIMKGWDFLAHVGGKFWPRVKDLKRKNRQG